MYTVELLSEAIEAARLSGFEVREEWLEAGGGACLVRGRKCLFLDLGLSPRERLRQALDALRDQPQLPLNQFSPAVARLLGSGKAA